MGVPPDCYSRHFIAHLLCILCFVYLLNDYNKFPSKIVLYSLAVKVLERSQKLKAYRVALSEAILRN